MNRLFHGSETYDPPPSATLGPVVTIGNFDGVHRGHRALLARLRAIATERGARTAVITFDPAPVEVLAPERARPRIQTPAERIVDLLDVVDDVIVERFDRDYARHDAAWFAREVLVERLVASAVLVGWDFRFGKDRGGDAASLAALLPVPVETFGPWTLDGEVVSSSRIRKAVLAGDVVLAAKLLGRPHRLTGTVVKGDGRGRTIGVPTANVATDTPLVPPHGVYAVTAIVDDMPIGGVMNFGSRPTFGGGAPTVEVHLLDWSGDLYDRRLSVDLRARLRDERKFASKDELVAQIHADIAAARAFAPPPDPGGR